MYSPQANVTRATPLRWLLISAPHEPRRVLPGRLSCESRLSALPQFAGKLWGLSSAGRAPDLHSGGQRFDPARLHQILDLIVKH